MNRRKFLYFLTNKEGKSYFVDDGIVKTTATPTPVNYAPSGWNDQVVKYTRNRTYTGIFPSYTIPLRFVKDAAKILRYRLYSYGIEDIVFLVVLRLNKLTGKHEGYFKGEIDFSKYNDTKDYFEANVTETGFFKYLKAYENTTFEIPIEGDGVENIQMDGLALTKKTNFAIVDGSAKLFWFTPKNRMHTIGCVYVNEEGTSFGYITGNSTLQDGFDEERYIIKNVSETPIVFTLNGTFVYKIHDNPMDINIYFKTSDNLYYYLVDHQWKPVGEHTVNINRQILLRPQQSLYILFERYKNVNASYSKIEYKQTNISFITKTKFKTTFVKAINAFELGNRLIKKITGKDDYFLTSPLLKNCGIYLTSGDALRGFGDAKIKTTWKDFFTSMDRNENIGMGIKDKEIIIKSKNNYYTNTLMFDLGDVSDVSLSIREDLMGSTIKIGYGNNDYDDVNGRDEFNNTHIYKTPVTRITKEIDITAKYRADPYGIEFTRINLENKTTTDSSSDNNVFMLDVYNNGSEYVLNRPNYSTITGVLNPTTIYNTRLSPKNLLIKKHGALLRSIFFKLDAKELEFTTTEKNAELAVTLNGDTIIEKSDIVIGTLPPPYFIPIEVKIKTVVPKNLTQIMSDGYGVFQFTYLGNTYKGFMQDCSQKPSGNEEQQWTLLLSVDNDLNKLIHG